MTPDAKAILTEMLQKLGFEPEIKEQNLEEGHLLNVECEDPGRLIGRQGQTLNDLQYLLNRILYKMNEEAPKVIVDVSGYRTQARDALVQKAIEAADKVARWGDIVELEPMNAFDRRIVHNALKDNAVVETHSVEVEGTDRKAILLRPKH